MEHGSTFGVLKWSGAKQKSSVLLWNHPVCAVRSQQPSDLIQTSKFLCAGRKKRQNNKSTVAESEVKIGWNDAVVRAKSQSHYFSTNSNVSLEIGNFGAPCRPSSTRSAHTHARTRGDHKCNFSITFPPSSLPVAAAPIDIDRPQTTGGSAHSYSQRFIQGARKAASTGMRLSTPSADTAMVPGGEI